MGIVWVIFDLKTCFEGVSHIEGEKLMRNMVTPSFSLKKKSASEMYGHQGGKEGVGGGGVMNWEIGIDMYTLICIK